MGVLGPLIKGLLDEGARERERERGREKGEACKVVVMVIVK